MRVNQAAQPPPGAPKFFHVRAAAALALRQPLMHRHPRYVSQRVFRIFNLLSQTLLDTLLKKRIVGAADSVISASPAHSSHTLQYLVGTMCLLTIAPRSRHVHRMHRE